jgi:hypothetical protein
MLTNSSFWLRLAPAAFIGLLLGQPHTSRAQAGPATSTVLDNAYTNQPVELVSMVAFSSDGSGQVQWITRQEPNSDHFLVEQSTDGRRWRTLAALGAHPRQPGEHCYSYSDNHLRGYGTPVVYYRVRQVGKQGRFSYSPTRAIWLDKSVALTSNPTARATATPAE